MLKTELDAGRPVAADFKYIGPQYPGGFADHTLSVYDYIAAQAGQATTRQALSQELDQILSERITLKDPVPPASRKKRKKFALEKHPHPPHHPAARHDILHLSFSTL